MTSQRPKDWALTVAIILAMLVVLIVLSPAWS